MRSESTDPGTPAITARLSPVKADERVQLLDVLRGVAILGMLFANNNAGAYTEFLLPSAVDRLTVNVVEILVRDKFWPLFALLFGVGFAVQLERAADRKVGIVAPYLRRLLSLGLIGALLGIFINVPQLIHLAIAGLPMLFVGFALRHRPLAWMVMLSTALCIGCLSLSISRDIARGSSSSGAPEITQEESAARIEQFRARAERYDTRDASWSLDRFGPRARATLRSYASLPTEVLKAEGLHQYLLLYMLLGIVLWRAAVLQEAGKHRRLFTWLVALCLPVGLGSSIFVNSVQHAGTWVQFGLAEPPSTLSSILLSPARVLASLCMGLAYIAGIAILVRVSLWRNVVLVLSPVGRMALTNYTIQALWPALVFGFYTPGVPLGSLGGLERITVLTGLFALQMILSSVWLRSYRFGPLEWVLRSITYWSPQPMRRDGAT